MQPQQPPTTPPVHLLQADVDRVTMSKAMPPPAALDKARFLTRFVIAPWRRRSDDDGTSIDVEAEQAVPSSGSVGQEPKAVASSPVVVKQEPKAAAFSPSQVKTEEVEVASVDPYGGKAFEVGEVLDEDYCDAVLVLETLLAQPILPPDFDGDTRGKSCLPARLASLSIT